MICSATAYAIKGGGAAVAATPGQADAAKQRATQMMAAARLKAGGGSAAGVGPRPAYGPGPGSVGPSENWLNDAITESKLFEFSFTNRQDAIYTKAELVVVDEQGREARAVLQFRASGPGVDQHGLLLGMRLARHRGAGGR